MKLNDYAIKRTALTFIALAALLSVTVAAQEIRSEFSVEGTGLFTKSNSGNGIQNGATDSGGLLIGYRYNINRWVSAEADYGYGRSTRLYSGNLPGRVQANLHQITGEAVVKLPGFAKLQPFVLAGGGALVFDPTGAGTNFVGASQQTSGAFLYGGGADYYLTRHWGIRAEYRGYVYKAPSFGVTSLKTDSWTNLAEPSAGVVFRF